MSRPTVDETILMIFAHKFGVNPDVEPDLMFIVKDCLENIPDGWDLVLGTGDNEGIPFFYDKVTQQSQWSHPREKDYIHRIELKRSRSRASSAASTPAVVEAAIQKLRSSPAQSPLTPLRSFKVSISRKNSASDLGASKLLPVMEPILEGERSVSSLLHSWDQKQSEMLEPALDGNYAMNAAVIKRQASGPKPVVVTMDTVMLFADYLGIDYDGGEDNLLGIAEMALRKLPPGYQLGLGKTEETKGFPYYINSNTGEKTWKHPRESLLRKKIETERRRKKSLEDDTYEESPSSSSSASASGAAAGRASLSTASPEAAGKELLSTPIRASKVGRLPSEPPPPTTEELPTVSAEPDVNLVPELDSEPKPRAQPSELHPAEPAAASSLDDTSPLSPFLQSTEVSSKTTSNSTVSSVATYVDSEPPSVAANIPATIEEEINTQLSNKSAFSASSSSLSLSVSQSPQDKDELSSVAQLQQEQQQQKVQQEQLPAELTRVVVEVSKPATPLEQPSLLGSPKPTAPAASRHSTLPLVMQNKEETTSAVSPQRLAVVDDIVHSSVRQSAIDISGDAAVVAVEVSALQQEDINDHNKSTTEVDQRQHLEDREQVGEQLGEQKSPITTITTTVALTGGEENIPSNPLMASTDDLPPLSIDTASVPASESLSTKGRRSSSRRQRFDSRSDLSLSSTGKIQALIRSSSIAAQNESVPSVTATPATIAGANNAGTATIEKEQEDGDDDAGGKCTNYTISFHNEKADKNQAQSQENGRSSAVVVIPNTMVVGKYKDPDQCAMKIQALLRGYLSKPAMVRVMQKAKRNKNNNNKEQGDSASDCNNNVGVNLGEDDNNNDNDNNAAISTAGTEEVFINADNNDNEAHISGSLGKGRAIGVIGELNQVHIQSATTDSSVSASASNENSTGDCSDVNNAASNGSGNITCDSDGSGSGSGSGNGNGNGSGISDCEGDGELPVQSEERSRTAAGEEGEAEAVSYEDEPFDDMSQSQSQEELLLALESARQTDEKEEKKVEVAITDFSATMIDMQVETEAGTETEMETEIDTRSSGLAAYPVSSASAVTSLSPTFPTTATATANDVSSAVLTSPAAKEASPSSTASLSVNHDHRIVVSKKMISPAQERLSMIAEDTRLIAPRMLNHATFSSSSSTTAAPNSNSTIHSPVISRTNTNVNMRLHGNDMSDKKSTTTTSASSNTVPLASSSPSKAATNEPQLQPQLQPQSVSAKNPFQRMASYIRSPAQASKSSLLPPPTAAAPAASTSSSTMNYQSQSQFQPLQTRYTTSASSSTAISIGGITDSRETTGISVDVPVRSNKVLASSGSLNSISTSTSSAMKSTGPPLSSTIGYNENNATVDGNAISSRYSDGSSSFSTITTVPTATAEAAAVVVREMHDLALLALQEAETAKLDATVALTEGKSSLLALQQSLELINVLKEELKQAKGGGRGSDRGRGSGGNEGEGGKLYDDQQQQQKQGGGGAKGRGGIFAARWQEEAGGREREREGRGRGSGGGAIDNYRLPYRDNEVEERTNEVEVEYEDDYEEEEEEEEEVGGLRDRDRARESDRDRERDRVAVRVDRATAAAAELPPVRDGDTYRNRRKARRRDDNNGDKYYGRNSGKSDGDRGSDRGSGSEKGGGGRDRSDDSGRGRERGRGGRQGGGANSGSDSKRDYDYDSRYITYSSRDTEAAAATEAGTGAEAAGAEVYSVAAGGGGRGGGGRGQKQYAYLSPAEKELSNILMKGIDIREANRRQRLAEKSVLGSQGQGQGRGRRRNFLGDEDNYASENDADLSGGGNRNGRSVLLKQRSRSFSKSPSKSKLTTSGMKLPKLHSHENYENDYNPQQDQMSYDQRGGVRGGVTDSSGGGGGAAVDVPDDNTVDSYLPRRYRMKKGDIAAVVRKQYSQTTLLSQGQSTISEGVPIGGGGGRGVKMGAATVDRVNMNLLRQGSKALQQGSGSYGGYDGSVDRSGYGNSNNNINSNSNRGEDGDRGSRDTRANYAASIDPNYATGNKSPAPAAPADAAVWKVLGGYENFRQAQNAWKLAVKEIKRAKAEENGDDDDDSYHMNKKRQDQGTDDDIVLDANSLLAAGFLLRIRYDFDAKQWILEAAKRKHVTELLHHSSKNEETVSGGGGGGGKKSVEHPHYKGDDTTAGSPTKLLIKKQPSYSYSNSNKREHSFMSNASHHTDNNDDGSSVDDKPHSMQLWQIRKQRAAALDNAAHGHTASIDHSAAAAGAANKHTKPKKLGTSSTATVAAATPEDKKKAAEDRFARAYGIESSPSIATSSNTTDNTTSNRGGGRGRRDNTDDNEDGDEGVSYLKKLIKLSTVGK